MKKPRFVRQDTHRHLKFGRHARLKQKWRRAKGRHSKVRRRKTGHPAVPSIGYGSPKFESGKIMGFTPVLINNAAELEKIKKGEAAILSARLGAKKKMDLIKMAEEKKIKVLNIRSAKK